MNRPAGRTLHLAGRGLLELLLHLRDCFHKLFLMIAVRVSPYAACFTRAESLYELNPVYFRRAWGMTAKVEALPDRRVAGVAHALRRRK